MNINKCLSCHHPDNRYLAKNIRNLFFAETEKKNMSDSCKSTPGGKCRFFSHESFE